MSPLPSHVDLLVTSRGVRRAAVDADTERLHRELSRLRTALVLHLQAERARLHDGPAATITRDGQRRLLALLDDLLDDTCDDAGTCTCVVRAAEIDHALRRQALLEANVIGLHPLAGEAP
ncbi:MAG TPA: hypothetical protein VFI47_06230 [Acidimicrobiales bacterium]|nr:hypothetical protein [Acidimicrobiales bacterium]